jgi:hypothetical protein
MTLQDVGDALSNYRVDVRIREGSLEPASRTATRPHSVVELLLDYLEHEGVEYIFGVPGGPLTSFFEALRTRTKIKYVLAKHEGGAAFMANSYARTTRRLAVCCVTSGPGPRTRSQASRVHTAIRCQCCF